MLQRTKKLTMVIGGGLLTAGLILSAAMPVDAQSSDDPVRFNVNAAGRDLIKLAIPVGIGDPSTGGLAQEVLINDLALSGFFKVLDPKAYLADAKTEGLGINVPDWRNIGAEGVIKARAVGQGAEVRFEFKLFELSRGDQPVLSKEYRGSAAGARQLVHQWAADVVKYYTKEDSFFASKIAFSSSTGPRRRDVVVMDWDGAAINKLTSSSQNILPSWAPSGAEVAFTSFMAGRPDLYALSLRGGKPRMLSNRPGLNMGAAFSPDGSKIALTLSQDSNSEIYLISSSGGIIKRLTNNPFIDTSPSWSPDGSRLTFVSDRHGSPQVWVMNADGSNQQRLTRRGNYNQTPRWSPRRDQQLIAFTGRDEKLSYDIFTINPDTSEMTRVTEGKGSNQAPSWAPNGRAVAYESTRKGVWISTWDGKTERQVYKGDASTPAWGPSLK